MLYEVITIPYRLKHFIDIICQPTLTFMPKPDGTYEGLLKVV